MANEVGTAVPGREGRVGDEGAQVRALQTESARVASDVGTGKVPGGSLSPTAESEALAWFLSADEIPATITLDVNVGTPHVKKVIPWTLRAIDSETLKKARKMAEEGGGRAAIRRARQSGATPEIDGAEANARILVAGSVDPDFYVAAKTLIDATPGERAHPDRDTDAVMLLRARLSHKPGLIDQLAMEVLSLSGYDDDDIVEHAAGKS